MHKTVSNTVVIAVTANLKDGHYTLQKWEINITGITGKYFRCFQSQRSAQSLEFSWTVTLCATVRINMKTEPKNMLEKEMAAGKHLRRAKFADVTDTNDTHYVTIAPGSQMICDFQWFAKVAYYSIM